MTWTYSPTDLSSNVAQVRLMISDVREGNPIFQDEELTAFLTLEGDDVRLGAAMALETIASQQVLVMKVIKILDLQTDGAKVADALLKRAALLRQQAETDAGDNFEIAELVYNDHTYTERIVNERLRG